MSARAEQLRIEDMSEAVDRIERYTRGLSRDTFETDEMVVDAVLRNLGVLGEAARHVSAETRALAPEIEWTKIVRSRHIVVHEYMGVDLDIVWRIVAVYLPPLRKHLHSLLARMGS